jgi:hypothetical protein
LSDQDPPQWPPPEPQPWQSGWQPPAPTEPGGWQAPPPQPQQQQQQPGGWQAPQQQTPWGAPPPPNSGKATASLVLSICGLLVCPLILSVLGLVFGYQARGEIDRSNGAVGGRGLATAGIVIGWVGIVVAILFIALIAAAVISFDDAQDF